MFKKLQAKFIAIIMVSVAVVLVIVFTGICFTEYQRASNNVRDALSTALDRAIEGDFSIGLEEGQKGAESDKSPGFDKRGQNFNGFSGPRIGGRDNASRNMMVPVAVYSITDTDTYTSVSGFATAEIDSDVLSSAIEKVMDISDGSGTFGELGLHYEKRTTETSIYMAFADISSTRSWESLAITLIIAGLATLLVFFVISYFLSKWALRPVQEAWDSQRQFVADASHELKTPLTVILANNSILLKHAQDTVASQSQWIESSQVEAENMQGLVNEMLELAQVESRAAIQHSPLDFSDLVDGVSLQFESVAFERGCTYEAAVDEGITLQGDESRLRKMISTLIENALKYVDEGGRVGVALRKCGSVAQLTISNTGSVISKEDLPHIFDRFYRTDKARTSGTGGYGLGLAIAREIAREHGGDITCSSSSTLGTEFVVTLAVSSN